MYKIKYETIFLKSRFVYRYYLYNGEIHPQDQEYTCLKILVDVFGFSQIIYGFDPRPPNPESESGSSQTLAGKKTHIVHTYSLLNMRQLQILFN